MTFYRQDGSAVLKPEEVAALVVQPTTEAAVATRVATTLYTASQDMRIPIVTDDVTAAWTAEGAEIAPSDPTVDEITVTPRKLAALTIVSSELAHDSSPDAVSLVGSSIARNLARALDNAWFGNTVANGPAGLASISGITSIPAGTITNTDPFVTAEFDVAGEGANVTAWMCNKNTAASLSKIKEQTGSNRNLLQPDAASPTKRAINGVPLFVVPGNAIADGVVWGVDRSRVYVVIREGADLRVDESVFFTSDRIAIRSTMRVGFAFPHPKAIVRIGAGGS